MKRIAMTIVVLAVLLVGCQQQKVVEKSLEKPTIHMLTRDFGKAR